MITPITVIDNVTFTILTLFRLSAYISVGASNFKNKLVLTPFVKGLERTATLDDLSPLIWSFISDERLNGRRNFPDVKKLNSFFNVSNLHSMHVLVFHFNMVMLCTTYHQRTSFQMKNRQSLSQKDAASALGRSGRKLVGLGDTLNCTLSNEN